MEERWYWTRAWLWAWGLLKSYWYAWLFGCVIWLVADVLLFKVYGRTVASQLESQSAMSEIIPGFLVFMGLLAIVLFTIAPVQSDRESKRRISTLTDQVNRYEDRAASKLNFVFEEGKYPYEVLEKQVGDLKVWLFRVGVKNIWYERLAECSVKMEAVSPHGERFLARNLKLAVDNPPDVLNIPHRQSFSINADDTIPIDVVRVQQRPSSVTMEVCYALEGHRDIQSVTGLVGGNAYLLTLKAMAELGRPFLETYIVEASPEKVRFARFKMPEAPDSPNSLSPAV